MSGPLLQLQQTENNQIAVSNFFRKALFIDRDGIINEDTAYPVCPNIYASTRKSSLFAKRRWEKAIFWIVITNQAGVAKGKYEEEDVVALHRWMAGEFSLRGIEIARFSTARIILQAVRSGIGTCTCRKPQPGMVEQAVKEFGIDIARSLVIGDKPSDRIAMDGLRSIIVKSRYTGNDFDVEGIADIEKCL